MELAEEKTRRMTFGRFAGERAKSFREPVGKFDFLGFTHICGVDNNGKFVLIRKPRQKSCRKFLERVKEWLKRHPHHDVWDRQRQVRRKSQRPESQWNHLSKQKWFEIPYPIALHPNISLYKKKPYILKSPLLEICMAGSVGEARE